MPRNERIESNRGARGAAQLLRRAIRLYIEGVMKLLDTARNIGFLDFTAQPAQLVHLKNLRVRAEND